jgi:peroxiredoxin
MAIARLRLSDFLEPTSSYLSMVELGLYETTLKVYASLTEGGVEPYSPEWNQEIEVQLARQRQAMAQRLWPAIPASKYLCFYPMDRRRGESKNWYQVPMAERQRLMHDHGMVGRRYAGEVKQIITGSIGFDDWEWGVDLFADDPLVFKKLIYEMRFDEVSAVYALFGTFYVGLRVGDLAGMLKT